MFFHRGPHTNLHNSINREVDYRNLIKTSNKKQEKTAKDKVCTLKDIFEIGDKFVLEDPQTKSGPYMVQSI